MLLKTTSLVKKKKFLRELSEHVFVNKLKPIRLSESLSQSKKMSCQLK